MPLTPPCRALGPQCTSLPVTIRIGTFEGDDPSEIDHDGTWLLGHTERISFRKLYVEDDDLLADAVLHVPCRYFKPEDGGARCAAHGFTGPIPPQRRRTHHVRQAGDDRFVIMDRHKMVERRLPMTPRRLPVLVEDNPCVGAPCRTGDNTRGAACCRDLIIEILCTERQTKLETLLRTRKSPYICKFEREEEDSVEVEIISACGYLEEDGVACTLHGRSRADGRTAKPSLCFDWPPKDPNLHTGCVFLKRRRR